jgi:hypothetical protein
VAVLDALQTMIQRINKQKMPVCAPSWKMIDLFVQYKDQLGINEEQARVVLTELDMNLGQPVSTMLYMSEKDVLALKCLDEDQKHI